MPDGKRIRVICNGEVIGTLPRPFQPAFHDAVNYPSCGGSYQLVWYFVDDAMTPIGSAADTRPGDYVLLERFICWPSESLEILNLIGPKIDWQPVRTKRIIDLGDGS
jgi:hypothetical protein